MNVWSRSAIASTLWSHHQSIPYTTLLPVIIILSTDTDQQQPQKIKGN
jgi:hypothetical protein